MYVWTERVTHGYDNAETIDCCIFGRRVGFIIGGDGGYFANTSDDHRLNDGVLSLQDAKRLLENSADFDSLSACGHEGHKSYTVEVRKFKVGDDPSIWIFHTEITHSVKGLWTQTFGSLELLNAYLVGLQTILGFEGFPSINLNWHMPVQWEEPSAVRWTMSLDGAYREELLNSVGAVIEV